MASAGLPTIHPLGLTRAQFVDAACARGRTAGAARDDYKALFREGTAPSSWRSTNFEVAPSTSVAVTG